MEGHVLMQCVASSNSWRIAAIPFLFKLPALEREDSECIMFFRSRLLLLLLWLRPLTHRIYGGFPSLPDQDEEENRTALLMNTMSSSQWKSSLYSPIFFNPMLLPLVVRDVTTTGSKLTY
ncbi:hypothetical protein PROFUN_06960 [Planoprotostelium fungivorum]|uniref:Uncharacterized protein n=1 Tax=Planoprotostelium fungivorum TaxID=1890364 RepID=A0A2P6NN66_9EUKA|nr:hypothetical protein PROFUN_06960 [Planoprotostelium fungivorum]